MSGKPPVTEARLNSGENHVIEKMESYSWINQ